MITKAKGLEHYSIGSYGGFCCTNKSVNSRYLVGKYLKCIKYAGKSEYIVTSLSHLQTARVGPNYYFEVRFEALGQVYKVGRLHAFLPEAPLAPRSPLSPLEPCKDRVQKVFKTKEGEEFCMNR